MIKMQLKKWFFDFEFRMIIFLSVMIAKNDLGENQGHLIFVDQNLLFLKFHNTFRPDQESDLNPN